MSDNSPVVRATVGVVSAIRGYDDITSILVRDKDKLESLQVRNILSDTGLPQNNRLHTVSDITEYVLRENTKWKKVKSLIPRARSVIISLGFLIIGFVAGGITF